MTTSGIITLISNKPEVSASTLKSCGKLFWRILKIVENVENRSFRRCFD